MKNVIIKMNNEFKTFSFELAVLEEMLVNDEKCNVMKFLKTSIFSNGTFLSFKVKVHLTKFCNSLEPRQMHHCVSVSYTNVINFSSFITCKLRIFISLSFLFSFSKENRQRNFNRNWHYLPNPPVFWQLVIISYLLWLELCCYKSTCLFFLQVIVHEHIAIR